MNTILSNKPVLHKPRTLTVPRTSFNDYLKVKKTDFTYSVYSPDPLRINLNLLKENMFRIENSMLGTKDEDGKEFWAGRKTDIGFFTNSNLDILNKLFKSLNIAQYNSFMDLGSGRGDVVFLAKIHCVKNVYGMEHDFWLKQISETVKGKLVNFIPGAKGCKFIWGNFLHALNFRNYDVLFNYIDRSEYVEMLAEKFVKEADPGAILILHSGHNYRGELAGYFIEKSIKIDDTVFYINQRSSLPYLSI